MGRAVAKCREGLEASDLPGQEQGRDRRNVGRAV